MVGVKLYRQKIIRSELNGEKDSLAYFPYFEKKKENKIKVSL
jgi:hypothetical protein